MKGNLRKFLSLILAMAMLFTVLPAAAFAAEGDEATVTSADGTVTPYATLAEAVNAATDGDTVTLLQNVDVNATVWIAKSITLDLDGRTVSGAAGVSPVIGVSGENVEAKIKGSNQESTKGKITSSEKHAVYVIGTDCSAEVSDCEISAGQQYAVYTVGTAEVILTNCNISAPSMTVLANGRKTTLTGCTINAGTNYGIYVSKTGGEVTLNGCTVSAQKASVYAKKGAVNILNTTVTATASGANAVEIVSSTDDGANVTVDQYSTINAPTNGSGVALLGSKLTLDFDGKVGGGAYGIVTNGSQSNDTIIVREHARINNSSVGMYLPATDSTTTIEGGIIEGAGSAVEIRGGNLIIKGGTFTTTSTSFGERAYDNGNTVAGAAVAVSQHTTNDDITVTIEGGTFNCVEGDGTTKALYEKDQQDGDSVGVTVNITGGTFEGPVESKTCETLSISDGTFNGPVVSEKCTSFISGGTFSEQVDETYCTEGFKPVMNEATGKFEVQSEKAFKITKTAEDGTESTTYYATLEAAIEAAGDNDTITLLRDTKNGGVKVPSGKNITIDFGGFTYTVTDQAVGSTGTETNAFQLLKDSNITFKNGTIDVDPNATTIKRMIQNYSNLTLEDMTLDGSKKEVDWVLSTLNGATVLKGNTNITAYEGQYAMGVYYWPKQSYSNVSITLDETMTGTVTGKVSYNDDGSISETANIAANAKIVIKAGTVNGSIEEMGTLASTEESGIEISGGSFSEKVVEKYCADGFVPVTEQDEHGNYTVKTAPVAVVKTAEGTVVKEYDNLQTAFDEVEAGQTVTLMQDVELIKGTRVTIAGKGKEGSPVTFDLNGHNLTGNVTRLFTVSGDAYVVLTDSSKTKGTIENKYTSNTYTVIARNDKANCCSTLVIDGGVNIKSYKYCYGVAANSSNEAYTSKVIVKNANVTHDRLYTLSVPSTYRPNDTLEIRGGTYNAWTASFTKSILADDCYLLISEKDGVYSYEVSETQPTDYIASFTDHLKGRTTAYLMSGDLYQLFNTSGAVSSTLDKQTVHVKKNVALTFPEDGMSIGNDETGSSIYTFTLDIDKGVEVSVANKLKLKIADIKLTGEGTLLSANGDIKNNLVPFNDAYYTVTYDEMSTTWQSRVPEDKAAAVLTLEDGSQLYFKALPNAFSKASLSDNSTLKLLRDFDSTNETTKEMRTSTSNGKSFTVDLNGKNIKYTNKAAAITVNYGTNVTFINTGDKSKGIIETPADATKATDKTFAIVISSTKESNAGGSVTIGEGVTVKGNVFLQRDAKLTVESGGTIDTTGMKYTYKDTDGTSHQASTKAIEGNGSGDGYNNTTITINDGAVVKSDSFAIFHPQIGEININGGTVEGGATGIEMRSGTLNMTGGTVTGNVSGDYTDTGIVTHPSGNGDTTAGAGIAVSQHTTNNPISVNISGGEVKGAAAVYENDLQDDITGDITLNITGGTFTGENAANGAVYSENCAGFVSGGIFSSDLGAGESTKAYLAEGYQSAVYDEATGKYEVQKAKVASVTAADGTVTEYTDLQEAFNAVEAGGKVTLLNDVTLADDTSVSIVGKGTADSNVIVDLDGHSIIGNNSKISSLATSDDLATHRGVLKIYGSHVTLTDTSDGEKGSIINNNNSSATKVSTIYVTNKRDDLALPACLKIENGVKIVGKKSYSASSAIYAAEKNTTDECGEVKVIINNAEISVPRYEMAIIAEKGGIIEVNG